MDLLLWDPVTGEERHIPIPDIPRTQFSAAVMCAAAGCDHVDCHGGAFLVAFVGTDNPDWVTRAFVYSSEAGEWSTPATAEFDDYVEMQPPVLSGDALYFICQSIAGVLSYDLRDGQGLSVIDRPDEHEFYSAGIVLIAAEDGGLIYAGLRHYSLDLWSLETLDGVVRWTQLRVIQLENLRLAIADPSNLPEMMCIAKGPNDSGDVIFMATNDGIYMIWLKSQCIRKVCEGEDVVIDYPFFPYMSFFTPAMAQPPANYVRPELFTQAVEEKHRSYRLRAAGLLPLARLVEGDKLRAQVRPAERMTRFQYDFPLLCALLDRWRPETHAFDFFVGEMTVTLQDVALLFGLPCAGQAMGARDVGNGWRDEFLARPITWRMTPCQRQSTDEEVVQGLRGPVRRDDRCPGQVDAVLTGGYRQSLCFRDQHYWKTTRHLVFDIYVEEYAVHRVMRQFGLYQASPVPVTHTLSADVHKWSRKGIGASTQWAEKLQSYVDDWADAPVHVVTEDRPHDDAAWTAYLTWYVPRTRTRVMYVPPLPPPPPIPDQHRTLPSATYPV
ncbi:hypothetical protein ACQ4PT_035983 [Festuca glaucescens]